MVAVAMADEPEPRPRTHNPNRADEPDPRTTSEDRGQELWATSEDPKPHPRARGDDTEPTARLEHQDRADDDTERRTRIQHEGRADVVEPRARSRRRDEEADRPTRIDHPNRRKPASKVTRLLVVLLLLVSAALMIIVTLGGWSTLEGAKPVQIGYILVYLLLAFFVLRWSRGVLPLIAALAIVLGIFAVVSVPGWYDREQPGFTDPGLPSDVLGLVTALIVPVQLLLIAVSLSGFRQAWNVEIERHEGDDPPLEPRRRRRGGRGHSPAPA